MRRGRSSYRPGQGMGEGYDPNRDTQWTRNAPAVLHYLDGGCLEVYWHGKWVPITPPETLQLFHLLPCRPGGWNVHPAAVPITVLTKR